MSNPGNLHLAIVLSLNNAMGAGLASARASLNGLSGAVNRLRQNWTSLHSLAAGAGVGLSLYAPVKAFAAQEDALARLDSTLMRAGGHLDAMTKPMKELAVLLGNELPGNTADYTGMLNEMIQSGIAARDVYNGLGRSAAYLNVVTGKRPEQAAETGRNFGRAAQILGIEQTHYRDFADLLQRAQHAGVDSSELMYGVARSTPKASGIQGFAEAQKWMSLLIYSTKMNGSGEVGGSSLRSIMDGIQNQKRMKNAQYVAGKLGVELDFFDKKTGKFKGLDNFMAQLAKLEKLNDKQKRAVVAEIAGPSGADAALLNGLINGGRQEIEKLSKAMREQAAIEERAKRALQTLSSIWDSASGTFTNFLAIVGEQVAPELKAAADDFQRWSASAGQWVSENRDQIRASVKTFVDYLALIGRHLGDLALVFAALKLREFRQSMSGPAGGLTGAMGSMANPMWVRVVGGGVPGVGGASVVAGGSANTGLNKLAVASAVIEAATIGYVAGSFINDWINSGFRDEKHPDRTLGQAWFEADDQLPPNMRSPLYKWIGADKTPSTAVLNRPITPAEIAKRRAQDEAIRREQNAQPVLPNLLTQLKGLIPLGKEYARQRQERFAQYQRDQQAWDRMMNPFANPFLNPAPLLTPSTRQAAQPARAVPAQPARPAKLEIKVSREGDIQPKLLDDGGWLSGLFSGRSMPQVPVKTTTAGLRG